MREEFVLGYYKPNYLKIKTFYSFNEGQKGEKNNSVLDIISKFKIMIIGI